VTRMAAHNQRRGSAARRLPPGSGVRADATVPILGQAARREGLPALRRVTSVDARAGRRCVFLANSFRLAARTVAGLCKERRQIEPLCKGIRQNLKIRSSGGATTNAVRTRIRIALGGDRLLALVTFANRLAASMQPCLRLVHLDLFQRRLFQAAFCSPCCVATPAIHRQHGRTITWSRHDKPVGQQGTRPADMARRGR